jgi:hypothetical protein
MRSCRQVKRIVRGAQLRRVSTKELVILLAHTTECTDCTCRITFAAAVAAEGGVSGIHSKIVDKGVVVAGSMEEH